jgi:hypothetical protein
VWVIVYRLTDSTRAAWVAWAGTALSAPVLFHGFTIYPDGAGAACTAVGIWLLVDLERGATRGRRALAVAGAVLAALPWLHTRFALVAGALGLSIGLRLAAQPDRLLRVSSFLVVPLVGAAAWFGYFWAIWGTPNPAAPYGSTTQSAANQLWPGLPGLLVDQQFGLISTAPVLAAAVLGVWPLARLHPRLAAELALVVVPYTLVTASYRMWWGGNSAPARFLVVVVPVAALTLGLFWQSARATGRAFVVATLALGLAMAGARAFVDDGALVYNTRDGYDLLLDRVNRSVNLPLALPSLHRDAVPAALGDIAAWVAVMVAALGLARLAVVRTGLAWVSVCAALMVGAMTASTVVWRRHADRVVTPGASQLDLLEHWRPALHTVGWQSRPFRPIDAGQLTPRLTIESEFARGSPPRRRPLFFAQVVPGADYEVIFSGSARPTGELTVTVGRAERPLERWSLDSAGGGLSPRVLHLPVGVPSLAIEGDEAARTSLTRVALRPRGWRQSLLDVRNTARGAMRYGESRVFFLDDNAFMELPGFWTRAGREAVVVIDTDAPVPPTLAIRAGPVATRVVLAIDGRTNAMPLGPGETRTTGLQGAGAWVIRIDTGAGFRPADHEPGSADVRSLGAWVELRE